MGVEHMKLLQVASLGVLLLYLKAPKVPCSSISPKVPCSSISHKDETVQHVLESAGAGGWLPWP